MYPNYLFFIAFFDCEKIQYIKYLKKILFK